MRYLVGTVSILNCIFLKFFELFLNIIFNIYSLIAKNDKNSVFLGLYCTLQYAPTI